LSRYLLPICPLFVIRSCDTELGQLPCSFFTCRTINTHVFPVLYETNTSSRGCNLFLRKEYVSLSNNLRVIVLFQSAKMLIDSDSTAWFLLLAVACLIVYSARIFRIQRTPSSPLVRFCTEFLVVVIELFMFQNTHSNRF
jgi:hypothetical protein